ncbi:Rho guanyl nucleotide exchange factor [Stachybotrys elegans]|uniref:Rho guanyl nucleotide exchange factor n=1 Tax=Stachybotrys elegans TaxID=80388 RepID=A0A8K0SSZ4_9HYPO|nr:Rho guanyl nucleotide exchange factor [Stachybotrys elegans]
MSFRGDDQRRYGHVPPVQYPVATQPNAQHHQQQSVARRPSFNSGDDGAYYGQPQTQTNSYDDYPVPGRSEDELFLRSPGSTSSGGRSSYGQTNSALSGYQHRYQDQAPSTPSQPTYNPQTFAQPSAFQRSQSTNLPYHPAPTSRYSVAPSTTSYAQAQSNYPPQSYNPAAYANAAVPQRHATTAGYISQEQTYNSATSSYNSVPYSPTTSSAYSPITQYPIPSPALSPGYQQSLPSPQYNASASQAQSYTPSQYHMPQFPAQDANGSGYGSSASQAPYPLTSQIPVGPVYADEQDSYLTRTSRPASQNSGAGSAYSHSVGSPGLQRHPTNAPLPSRPMEGVAEEYPWDSNGRHYSEDYGSDELTQESIMQDIEAELGNPGRRHPRPLPVDSRSSDLKFEQLRRYGSDATTIAPTTSSRHRSSFEYDDDDDPEGTAGVLAMQQAELDERRFSGTTLPYTDSRPIMNTLQAPAEEQAMSSSESEVGGGNVDLGMLSGGYAGNLTYGQDYGSPRNTASTPEPGRPLPTPAHYNTLHDGYNTNAPAFNNAEMDYGGTGGLQQPRGARLSFDEGEERVSLHSRQSGTDSPAKDDLQDLFYHPGLSNRPLPALPPGNGSDSASVLSGSTRTNSRNHHHSHSHSHSQSFSSHSRNYSMENPEAFYSANSAQTGPERSISLVGHSNTPPVQAPARSRTDATEDRKKGHRLHQHNASHSASFAGYEPSPSTSVGGFDSIQLPSGRKRKFIPSKLTAGDFRKCLEPWALSGIEAWVREMAEGDVDLKEKTIEDALTLLFTTKVPTMNVADAEALASRAVMLMLQSGTLQPEEEWVKFGGGRISGVLWQLTGQGCYSSKLHEVEISGRCYSYHCTRTLKKVDLDELRPGSSKPTDEWHVFYNLKKEDWEAKPKKEVDRQNILHEIVTGEENYIKQLDIFRTLYRDTLRASRPPIIHPDKRDRFLNAVFGKLDTVLGINKGHLLSQLKYRQQEQGPWITGFSDIFREWIRKAKSDYIEYATGYPRATYMVRKEADRNIIFRKFLEDKRQHKSSSKQDWTHFLIAPLQRLQRYILLLESVEQKMLDESEEKSNLQRAIQEIKTVTHECDAKVAETNKRVEMMDLDRMLVLRPGCQSVLNLDHLGRELIMQGELQRMGSKGVRWVDTHALLFDHYMILAKVVGAKDGRGDKKYDVSREPIPMPLLFLESMNDEPIQKQKGIAPLARNAPSAASSTQLSKVATNNSGRPVLEHASTTSSLASSQLTTTTSNDSDSKILYPFRVKHLGHEVYTLYASSAQNRYEWCTKIVEAKTRHAKALFAQNAEPFRLRVLADASFHYDGSSPYARAAGVPVKETPLDRAIQDLERVLGPAVGVPPVCRAQVNCAAGFSAFGKSVIAIGTDYGVFIADPSNPRGWSRTVQVARVTQMAVLEEFSVCLIIADKSLISYPLDVIAPVSEYAAPLNDNPRRAPQRLAKDVTYFATAKMKDRTLVFYKRKEGLHTSFKVLEPIFHKSTEKKSRLFSGRKTTGSTESFRDFDEFFFPTECYSLSLFQTYIAVSTSRGIEMLTLDKKQPMSIPDLKAPAIANIASRIRDQRPLGMFRLNENEFILTYEDCAVYVDKHGDVSRTLIMEYTGKQKKAKGATMYGQYLLLFNEDYVEVRNAENGRLRQIIAGRDVRVLDYGERGPTGWTALQAQQTFGQNGQLPNVGDASKGSVKIAMCHPELQGRQIILEMLLNDGHTEN